jgi:molybdopterin molybdotransferase
VLTVEEALEQILARAAALPVEHVGVIGALGRVLAEPIVSRREIPPWPNSSMDGYALRAADTREDGVTLAVVGEVAAGTLPEKPVRAGEAMRIFTGAPLPPGTDAVVPQEDVQAEDGHVRVPGAVPAGAFVRSRGEDVRVGDVVLQPGRPIGPPEIALLATLGHAQVRVYRRPRVAILSTGTELADLGTEPGPGQIPNTNTYALVAQVLEAGATAVSLGVAPDDLGAIETRLADGLAADVLISSAGVSVGDHDLVRAALERSGAELHLWKVSMRPGKPITFGSLGRRLVFGLPGNPVSAMVTFELFVRPALRQMMGHRALHRARVRARALTPIVNRDQRRGYLRVALSGEGDGLGARLTGEQGSAIVRSMVAADGLVIVPGQTTIPTGASVEVILLRALDF